jgi:thioredoxin reductase
VAIVGAGPHGLAAAAHLRAAGLEVRVFGEVMGFWRKHMPRDMLLRSTPRASSIASPGRTHTVAEFGRSRGRMFVEPLPLVDFLDYATWYRAELVPDVDPRPVAELSRTARGLRLELDGGESLEVERVIVAAGIAPFAHRPAEFETMPEELVSHSCDHVDFAPFRGRRVVVVGAGQSAVESAALLAEAGAQVELVARAPVLSWTATPRPTNGGLSSLLSGVMNPPTGVGGRGISWIAALPDVLRPLPAVIRADIDRRCMKPLGAWWLRDRIGGVHIALGRSIVRSSADGHGARLSLDDGTTRDVDHVLLATGYRVDLERYEFLARDLLHELRRRDGYPVLDSSFQSSVPGLFFVGAPAAGSFGPIMRFVIGSWYSAPTVAARIAGRRTRLVTPSF